jgi:hypothetical protein
VKLVDIFDTFYRILQGGRALNVGDCALFQAGNAPPFIGILRKVTLETVDQVKLTVNWLYRPTDIKLAKGSLLEAAPNEIFYSFHRDVISDAKASNYLKEFLRLSAEESTTLRTSVYGGFQIEIIPM